MTKTQRINSIFQQIKSITGSLTRSHNETRRCSRCQSELTDYSSIEMGIGPICNKKSTAILAKQIPANFSMATMCALTIKKENLVAETIPVWENLFEILLDKTVHASNAEHNQGLIFQLTGEDTRLIVGVVDWLLSFRMPMKEKQLFIDIVKYLGYIGLSGVLSGISSTGEAKIDFDDGKLTLVGSSNKEGFKAMKKIPGATVPRYRGDKTPYKVPAKEYERFFEVAMEYWPCFIGDIPQIKEACCFWLEKNKVNILINIDNKPIADIVSRNNDFSLKLEWIKDISQQIIDKIKFNIPSSDRKYEPSTHIWYFKLHQKENVLNIVRDIYFINFKENDENTPSGLFNPSKTFNNKPYYKKVI